MPLNRTVIVLTLITAAACQQSTSTAAPPVAATATSATATVPTQQPAGPEPFVSARRPGPPSVKKNADGSVRVEFVDQWGHDFDATFENADYFKRAVPVITRGMTAEQVGQFNEASKTLAQ